MRHSLAASTRGTSGHAGLRVISIATITAAIALSSATTLRVQGLPVGIGEVLAFACIALRWIDPTARAPAAGEDFGGGVRTFRALLLAVLASAAVSTVAAPWVVGPVKAAPPEQAMRNLLALWLACAFAEATTTLAVRHRLQHLGMTVLTATVGLHGALLAISLVANASWAKSMWYGQERFAGLAENPNQLGLCLVATACAAAALAARSTVRPWMVAAVMPGLAGLALATRSEASLLALGVLCLLAILLHAPGWSAFAQQDRKAAGAAGFAVLLAMFALAASPLLTESAGRLYDAGAQGSDRMHLWSSAFEVGMTSPVIGLGPAAHALLPGYPGAHEAHSTILDWWTMTGALGTAVLVWLFAGAGWDMAQRGNRWGLCGLAALVVFSAFHLVIRQPAFWFALGMCYAAGAQRLHASH